MMTPEEIEQCQKDYERVEMADLGASHLRSERDLLYRKWFAKMLDHIHGRSNAPWNEGIRQ